MFIDIGEFPELDLGMQAVDLPGPITPYGSRSRTERVGGTVHFYVADRRFTRLWACPDRILLGGYTEAVEPNFSTPVDLPRAHVLFDVYRKRVLGRYWQGRGLRVWVDLNVHPDFLDLAFLGVPPGWSAYATRRHREFPLSTLDVVAGRARAHAGEAHFRFAVFGGGRHTLRYCLERGWLWVPDRSDVVRGRV